MRRPPVHLLTPGDHYSPRTGSAVPTVVHGLAAAAAHAPRTRVLVARGTYPDRYDDADVIEYDEVRPRSVDRWTDLALGRTVGVRPGARRVFSAPFVDQASWDPGVVFAHNAVEALPAVDRHRHVPVLWAHNQLFRTYSRREAGRAAGRAAAIVCVSDFLADEVRAALPAAAAGRVATVRNGVDTDEFRPLPRPAGSDRLDVLVVGRVVPEKGALTALRAVERLGRDDIRLTIVGSAGFSADLPLTGYEREVRRQAEQLGDAARVVPFLPRGDVCRLMGEADVLVVPSEWGEPFALTALEGLAAGNAVVASRIGGIPEAVGDAGLLVEPGDVDALADALASLADSPARLEAAQASGRAFAMKNDWRARLVDLDALVDRLS